MNNSFDLDYCSQHRAQCFQNDKPWARFLILVFLGSLLILSGACSDPAEWYPRGVVELVSYYELESDSFKYLYVTVAIRNTGVSPISRSTFGVSAQTESGNYYNTVVSELRILPAARIWTTLAIQYAGLEESLVGEGISVGYEFFE